MPKKKVVASNDKGTVYEMKVMSDEQKTTLRMAMMIITGILGSITLIGIFWGRESIVNLGLIIGTALMLAIFIAGMWVD